MYWLYQPQNKILISHCHVHARNSQSCCFLHWYSIENTFLKNHRYFSLYMRLNLWLLFYPNIHWKLHSRAKLLREKQQIWRPNQVLDPVTMTMKWHFSFSTLQARVVVVVLPSWIYFFIIFPLFLFSQNAMYHFLYDFFVLLYLLTMFC